MPHTQSAEAAIQSPGGYKYKVKTTLKACAHPNIAKRSSHLMLIPSIEIIAETNEQAEPHIYFVLDKSSSMKISNRMDTLKKAVISTINDFSNAQFTAITFDKKAEVLFSARCAKTKEEKKELGDIINNIKIGHGTSIEQAMDALAEPLKNEKNLENVTIFLLTDGEDSNMASQYKKVFKRLTDSLGKQHMPKLISLGLGQKYDASLLANMAAFLGTFSIHIPNTQDVALAFNPEDVKKYLKPSPNVELEIFNQEEFIDAINLGPLLKEKEHSFEWPLNEPLPQLSYNLNQEKIKLNLQPIILEESEVPEPKLVCTYIMQQLNEVIKLKDPLALSAALHELADSLHEVAPKCINESYYLSVEILLISAMKDAWKTQFVKIPQLMSSVMSLTSTSCSSDETTSSASANFTYLKKEIADGHFKVNLLDNTLTVAPDASQEKAGTYKVINSHFDFAKSADNSSRLIYPNHFMQRKPIFLNLASTVLSAQYLSFKNQLKENTSQAMISQALKFVAIKFNQEVWSFDLFQEKSQVKSSFINAMCSLDDSINQRCGLSTEKSLLTAYMLGKLVQEGQLAAGKVHILREAAWNLKTHAFVIYQTEKQLLLIDSSTGYHFDLTQENEAARAISSYQKIDRHGLLEGIFTRFKIKGHPVLQRIPDEAWAVAENNNGSKRCAEEMVDPITSELIQQPVQIKVWEPHTRLQLLSVGPNGIKVVPDNTIILEKVVGKNSNQQDLNLSSFVKATWKENGQLHSQTCDLKDNPQLLKKFSSRSVEELNSETLFWVRTRFNCKHSDITSIEKEFYDQHTIDKLAEKISPFSRRIIAGTVPNKKLLGKLWKEIRLRHARQEESIGNSTPTLKQRKFVASPVVDTIHRYIAASHSNVHTFNLSTNTPSRSPHASNDGVDLHPATSNESIEPAPSPLVVVDPTPPISAPVLAPVLEPKNSSEVVFNSPSSSFVLTPVLESQNSSNNSSLPANVAQSLTAISPEDIKFKNLIDTKLIPMTQNYLLHLKTIELKKMMASSKPFRTELGLLGRKITEVENLLTGLNRKMDVSQKVRDFYTRLDTYAKDITAHRDSKTHRYIKNAVLAISIVAASYLYGLGLAALVLYANFSERSSLFFWRSQGENLVNEMNAVKPIKLR